MNSEFNWFNSYSQNGKKNPWTFQFSEPRKLLDICSFQEQCRRLDNNSICGNLHGNLRVTSCVCVHGHWDRKDTGTCYGTWKTEIRPSVFFTYRIISVCAYMRLFHLIKVRKMSSHISLRSPHRLIKEDHLRLNCNSPRRDFIKTKQTIKAGGVVPD